MNYKYGGYPDCFTYGTGAQKTEAAYEDGSNREHERLYQEVVAEEPEYFYIYLYDDNGNMKEDKNKGITAIDYNILNLPKKVTYSTSKYIEYTYDASGAKLSQKVVDAGTTRISDFVAGFVYENNDLQFMQHNEGRVVAKRTGTGTFDSFQYQYHLKDHLGNVRVTFKTEQITSELYMATSENDVVTTDYESTYFSKYSEVTRINANIFDHSDAGSEKTYSIRLNGTANEIYGLGKSLAVNPGDVVDAEVWAKYLDPATKGKAGSAFAQLVRDLSDNVSSVIVDGAKAVSTPAMPFAGLIDRGTEASGVPKAYLTMLVFDHEYKLLKSNFKQIGKEAAENGSDIPHQYLNTFPMTITEPGFVYIYLSNENGTPVEVFFDDFSVTHTGTDVVQKDDYYPFGGSFNAYTYLSTPQQDYLYNGVRLNKTTQLYETAFRTYDPYLGRFNHIDPLAAMVPGLSPYHFGFNNPVRYNDPLGLMGQDPGIWGTGDTYASNNSQNPFDFMPKFTRTNPGSGNHWSDDNIPGNPNDQAIRDYYLLSGSAFEKKYGAYQSNTVIIAGSLYVIWNITRWKEYDGVANEKSFTYERTFSKAQANGGSESFWDDLKFLGRITNPHALPDAISFAGNLDVIVGGGIDLSKEEFNKLIIIQGKDAGKSTSYTDISLAAGLDVGASAVLTKYYYTGDIATLNLQDFDGFRFAASVGISAIIEVGGGISIAPVVHGGYIIGISTHIGVSPPGVSGNGGGGFTRIRK